MARAIPYVTTRPTWQHQYLPNYQFNGRRGHFIDDDVAAFDAPFFSVTSKEAKAMDPMQRWTLEASYRAFEKGSKTATPHVRTRMGILTAFFLQRASPSRASEAPAPQSFLPPCWKTI